METYKPGFTLIEIVVTVGIIGLMAGLLVVALPQARQNQDFQLAEQQLQSLIRLAQEQALNGKINQDCDPDDQVNPTQCRTYGLSLVEEELVLFFDVNANRNFDQADQIITREKLSSTVTVTMADFIFEPALPRVAILADGDTIVGDQDSNAVITIRQEGREKQLQLLSSGAIIEKDENNE